MSKDTRKTFKITSEMQAYIRELSNLLSVPENSVIKLIIFEYMNRHKI